MKPTNETGVTDSPEDIARGSLQQHGSALWECDYCHVTGTWDEWKSAAEPGAHKCDICLECGRSGAISQVKAPNEKLTQDAPPQ